MLFKYIDWYLRLKRLLIYVECGWMVIQTTSYVAARVASQVVTHVATLDDI